MLFWPQMKLTYTLQRKDNVRIFLRHYYFSGWKWLRRLGGPFIILMGLYFYWAYEYETHKFIFAFAAFSVGYGLYYTLKPFIFVLMRYKKFGAETISLELTGDNRLAITESTGRADLDLSKISSVQMMEQNMVLTFDSKASLYVLRDRVEEGDLDAFFIAIHPKIQPKPAE